MAQFKKLSRYTNGIVTTTRSGTDFLVLRKSLNLQPDNSDVFVEITGELTKRPDLISQKAYGTPDLWWVIYEFNGISDPLFDIQQGQFFRIPAIDRVTKAIKSLNKT